MTPERFKKLCDDVAGALGLETEIATDDHTFWLCEIHGKRIWSGHDLPALGEELARRCEAVEADRRTLQGLCDIYRASCGYETGHSGLSQNQDSCVNNCARLAALLRQGPGEERLVETTMEESPWAEDLKNSLEAWVEQLRSEFAALLRQGPEGEYAGVSQEQCREKMQDAVDAHISKQIENAAYKYFEQICRAAIAAAMKEHLNDFHTEE